MGRVGHVRARRGISHASLYACIQAKLHVCVSLRTRSDVSSMDSDLRKIIPLHQQGRTLSLAHAFVCSLC